MGQGWFSTWLGLLVCASVKINGLFCVKVIVRKKDDGNSYSGISSRLVMSSDIPLTVSVMFALSQLSIEIVMTFLLSRHCFTVNPVNTVHKFKLRLQLLTELFICFLILLLLSSTGVDRLFEKVSIVHSHPLHLLLPAKRTHPYNLRRRSHNYVLTVKYPNFINRLLYRNNCYH